jgi:hypothetical protein
LFVAARVRANSIDTLIYDHDNTADDVVDILRADPHLDGAYCHFRVLMLAWAFDRFQLRVLNLKCSAVKLQDFTRIKDSRLRREMTETGIEAYLLSCGSEDDGAGTVKPPSPRNEMAEYTNIFSTLDQDDVHAESTDNTTD